MLGWIRRVGMIDIWILRLDVRCVEMDGLEENRLERA